MDDNKNIEKYLNGELLYGDDFNIEEIKKWYDDEKEASEELRDERDLKGYKKKNKDYKNIFYGFRFVKSKNLERVVSLGGAYGDELKPVLDFSKEIFIIEPSSALVERQSNQNIFKYLLANVDGKIDLSDNSVDFVMSIKTLHHIPNVSFVVGELFRILKPGGYAIISEPITSMGDWRKPRQGLTKRERGIPVQIFDRILEETGFKIVKRDFCVFSPLSLIFARKLKLTPYNNSFFVYIDYILSKIFKFNIKYCRRNVLDKISPSEVFYVCKK